MLAQCEPRTADLVPCAKEHTGTGQPCVSHRGLPRSPGRSGWRSDNSMVLRLPLRTAALNLERWGRRADHGCACAGERPHVHVAWQAAFRVCSLRLPTISQLNIYNLVHNTHSK